MLTRKQALAAGLKRYFTGRPCPHGHVAMRRISGACCECHRLDKLAWRKANPERVRLLKSVWSKANPEGQAARSRKWQLANKEKANASHYCWAARNPAKVTAAAARRRARVLRQTPAWADHAAIEVVYQIAQKLRENGRDVHVDHFIPLRGKTVCGLHVANNLQVIPATENYAKSNRYQEQ